MCVCSCRWLLADQLYVIVNCKPEPECSNLGELNPESAPLFCVLLFCCHRYNAFYLAKCVSSCSKCELEIHIGLLVPVAD
jgi:hypothetical protein